MKTGIKRFLALFKRRQAGRGKGMGGALAPGTPDVAALDVLPERTLLGEGRYRVLNVYTTTETLDEAHNVYTARGTTSLSRCPHCNAPIAGEETQSCARCGADLRGITLIYPKFLVRESADPQTFEASAQLAALRLRHPALIVPEDVFTETTFGPPRYYRVEPIFKPAQDVTSPQPVEKVLQWGIALAQGMAYLHQRYVTLQKIDLEHIVINDGIARHVCIDNVSMLPREVHTQSVVKPSAVKPSAVKPSAVKPRGGKPSAVKPSAVKPSVVKPSAVKPSVVKLDDTYFAENVRALAGILLALLGAPNSAPGSEVLIALLARAQQTGKTAGVFAAVLEGTLRGLRAPENVRLQMGALTDVGRVRTVNEDSVLALDLAERFAALGLPVGVYAVADGMGGHAAGDVASQLTIRTIQEAVGTLHLAGDRVLLDARAWMEQTAAAANQVVYTQRRAVDTDMGCTLVFALTIGGRATIANIGDSRAYWLAADGATQITTDHSLVERLVAVGHITAQEAREHPHRNVIYRAVGDKPKADFDLFEQVLAPGEALLLCSDGLSGMLSAAQIWMLWRAASSPQAACEQLVEAANQAGGTDNISVVIIQAGAVEV